MMQLIKVDESIEAKFEAAFCQDVEMGGTTVKALVSDADLIGQWAYS